VVTSLVAVLGMALSGCGSGAAPAPAPAPAPAAAGFSISTSPSAASAAPGSSSAAVTVNTGVASGSAQSVGLSLSGAPSGVTGTFAPASVNAGGSSQLTLTVAGSVTPGNYPLTVKGTAASATHTTTVTLTVIAVASPTALSVRVVGNHLVDGNGHVVRLLGVDRPGMGVLNSDGSCVDFNVSGSPNEIDAMANWHINAVRIPLNEDCWLGINGATSATAGPVYQAALHAYVSALHQHGMYAILDLHRSAPGIIPSTDLQAMPDADHAPVFWSSVASSFKNDAAIVFDLFNEPHLANVLPAGSNYWACWLSGCTVPTLYSNGQATSFSYQAAGMQQLVNAVRSTGAIQPLMLEGLNYANSLTPVPSDPSAGWLTYTPVDSAHQLMASVHVYNEAVGCVNLTCWNQQYVPVAAQYPVVTGEFGEADCAQGFMDQYMQFADANGISYLAWSWSIQTNCASQANMGLITDSNWTPSQTGIGLKDHLTALAQATS
jgi:hypothetical protein